MLDLRHGRSSGWGLLTVMSKSNAAVRPAASLAVGVLIALCSSPVLGADKTNDDDEGPSGPNVYLDYRTTFSALPPGVVAFGLGGFPRLQFSSEASKLLVFDFPFTIDLTDRLTIYGGPTASTSRTDTTSWRQMTLDSWSIGFSADVYQQNGGLLPTVTLQSTLTRAIPDTPTSSTSTTTNVEFGYALDEDETRGLLAGVQYTNVLFDSSLPQVKPLIAGYVGGYYQWDNNWKLTGRAGVQSFGGAQVLLLQPVGPFTKPVFRLDLEKLDDNDNRMFGITAEIAWMPKPVYSLVLRTPLYFVKN